VKVKNLTPFPFATKVTSRRKRQPEMTLVLRACYVLAPGKPLAVPEGPKLVAQGPMTADTYRDDDAERAGECLYPGDFGDWKPHAEVMLRGACHVPGGKSLPECPVRFSVGRWSKTLHVVGRRKWTGDERDAVMTKPVPFAKIPVDYAHAFGGAGYAANPVGTGVGNRELPSIEHARKTIRARKDDPGPAGFGPINPAWAPRAGKVGKKYDARWKRDRFPYYADDFDWTYFNAAPADQQLEGYLRGDEKVAFENLHPAEPRFEVRLPGQRMRAFVKDARGRFREVRMNLDTLFADLEGEKLFLTWRGLEAIESDDMKDVLWGLVAPESLEEKPLPEAHYRERLEKFEADPLEIDERMPGELLEKFEEMKARQKARDEGMPVSKHDGPPPDALTASLRAMFDKLPVSLPGAKDIEQKVAAAVASAIASGPPQVDVKAQIAQVANDMAASLAKPSIPSFPLRAGGPPPAWAAKKLQQALDGVEGAKKKLAATEKLPPEVRAKADEEIARLDEQVEEMKREPFFQAILNRPRYQDPGPGKDLHAQDYEGRDLRGHDLRGANLTDANLTGAKLAAANLAGANLEGAVLCGADLTEADLTDANLTLANLTGVRAPRAVLRDTRLDRAFLQGADLQGAVLRGAKGDQVYFPDADLGGADGQGISLLRSFGKGARLAGADLSGASLVRCLLVEVSAPRANFSRAVLTRTSFSRSDLGGASFRDARGERSVWLRAKLDDADFTGAVLASARLLETSASRTGFRGAVLREARCYRASFEQADFSGAQLFGIEFSKCRLTKARFKGTCLYGAKFRQAVGGGCDFTDANLTRAVLEEA
jgi:uncharacterized protein YjbI with pentapeptide repeats